MIDPTHKALVVLIKDHKVTDVYVGSGPNFAIGEDHLDPKLGTRLLLAEVKTSTIEMTDRTIWTAATTTYKGFCLDPDTKYSVRQFLWSYEEHSVPVEDRVVWPDGV